VWVTVGPASVLRETARPDLAAVVKQALTDVLPDRMRTEKLDGIEPLDLDGPEASTAFDPKQFTRDLRQPPLLEGNPGPPGGARVPEDAFPIFLGKAAAVILVRPSSVDAGLIRRDASIAGSMRASRPASAEIRGAR
jgi:hypothetical protein